MTKRKVQLAATEPSTEEAVRTLTTTTQTLLAPKPSGASRANDAPTEAALSASPQPEPRNCTSPVLEAAVERVLSTVDHDGLSEELTSKLADQLLGRVRVDTLVTTILGNHEDEVAGLLSKRLLERILGVDPGT